MTAPNFVSILIEDSPKIIKKMRHDFEAVGAGKDETKQLVINSMDGYSIESEEFYLEEKDGKPELLISFLMQGEGKVSGTISIPLSDVVLMDIIEHSIKRLNKLKAAMNSLK